MFTAKSLGCVVKGMLYTLFQARSFSQICPSRLMTTMSRLDVQTVVHMSLSGICARYLARSVSHNLVIGGHLLQERYRTRVGESSRKSGRSESYSFDG